MRISRGSLMGENDCFGKHIEMYAFLKLMF